MGANLPGEVRGPFVLRPRRISDVLSSGGPVKSAAIVWQAPFRTADAQLRAAFRPATLWLLPARVEQTRVGGSPVMFGQEIARSGSLSLHDCGKHRLRL